MLFLDLIKNNFQMSDLPDVLSHHAPVCPIFVDLFPLGQLRYFINSDGGLELATFAPNLISDKNWNYDSEPHKYKLYHENSVAMTPLIF